MSSSMRNAIQRRNHKERSQPAERAKWGLLEKHKDYVLRSRDYNRKRKTLAKLSSIARDRNPDEFYFAMKNRRLGRSERKGQEAEVLDHEEVMVLKTQDAGYLRMQSTMERRKIEDLEERLQFAGEGKHTVFVENQKEAEEFDASEWFDTPEELLERRENRVKTGMLKEGAVGTERLEAAEGRKKNKARGKEYRELEARMKREEDLRRMEREVEEQRARMGKNSGGKRGKWAKIRKR